MDLVFVLIVSVFLVYYFTVLIFEKKLISEAKDIIDKFLSITLMYAGISLIYYSMTGQPLLSDSEASYNVYIFIMGFVAILWTIPHLLSEFRFFRKFMRKKRRN
jgi:uncharacterized membrane protein